MKKPIGFRSYQNDEEPDKRDELEKQQAERLNWYMSCRTLSMSLRWRWPNNCLMPGTM